MGGKNGDPMNRGVEGHADDLLKKHTPRAALKHATLRRDSTRNEAREEFYELVIAEIHQRHPTLMVEGGVIETAHDMPDLMPRGDGAQQAFDRDVALAEADDEDEYGEGGDPYGDCP